MVPPVKRDRRVLKVQVVAQDNQGPAVHSALWDHPASRETMASPDHKDPQEGMVCQVRLVLLDRPVA